MWYLRRVPSRVRERPRCLNAVNASFTAVNAVKASFTARTPTDLPSLDRVRELEDRPVLVVVVAGCAGVGERLHAHPASEVAAVVDHLQQWAGVGVPRVAGLVAGVGQALAPQPHAV